jgi:methyl-accepting chemotaxis protein
LDAINKIQGVIEFDLKGNILSVNENFAKVTGYSESEIVGNHHSMFVDNDQKASAEYKAFWDKLGRGEPDEGVYKRIGKGGKEIWLQATYNPIYGLDGKAFKVVKYATDITVYKLKEADNAGQIDALNKVLGVIEFDLKGNITKVNENFAKVTGYSVDEIVGSHHSMFAEDKYKNSLEYKAFWADLADGKSNAGQYKRVGKGGKSIWLEASYNPILDLNGKPFKVVKFATDITAQHDSAEALKIAVEETQDVIEAAKQGDLTNRVPLEGKSGAIASMCDGVNALMDKMTEVLMTIREAGETINTAAGEISTGNTDLSSRTEQQASNLEETASSMEELASTVKQNAENAKQANQLAAAASGVAVKGGDVVGQVVTTMSAINESAQKIEDIITVIDGIAFQTNILALNAAVEAARAGEQGRGFAVVAGEVRNLAQRSASAAKEIKELITDSVTKTSEGTQLVENAGTTMQEIVSSVQRVTDIMGEITAASNEQSAGIDQVNQAVTSMDETTQQNAALVEEAAAAAESLVDQAISLMETVNEFNLDGRSGTQERRSTNSPMRPARAASNPAPKSAPAKVTTKAKAKTGTDDGDWEEF